MHEKLLAIQSELKVPKSQRNSFGNYNYRSCEDIVEAVKPLCAKHGVVLTLSDEIVVVGAGIEPVTVGNDPNMCRAFGTQRVYVKATARITHTNTEIPEQFQEIVSYGWAREAESKKGMDEAQITGSASSYARKYALNGLFAIDDTKDPDATNDHGKKGEFPEPPLVDDDLDL